MGTKVQSFYNGKISQFIYPSSSIMAEIADLTYNMTAFPEIMGIIWKTGQAFLNTMYQPAHGENKATPIEYLFS